jgi:prepilin-type N-terminal cleavage/methylation domain-containing protein
MNYRQRQNQATAKSPTVTDRGSGFTLVEVMIALFLVVLGLTSAAMFFGSMSRAALFTEHTVTATGLAQAKLEELVELPYSSMLSGEDSVLAFHRNWDITPDASWTVIEAHVSWLEISGHTQTVALTTIRTH